MFDVAIVGGGPAGSVCASRLAARGRKVVVFERAKHPRFHLGESLLPQSLGVLRELGLVEELASRFMIKRGARFVDGDNADRHVRYVFADAFHMQWDHAFQVPRDEFDELLFRRASAAGADTREGWEATSVLREAGNEPEGARRAVGLEVRDPSGDVHRIEARMVVDATGRDALVARSGGPIDRIPGLDRTALFTQVRGAWRDEGDRVGDIQIVVFGQGDERGWFWLIPFADGRTSVGAVVSAAWIRARRALGGPPALFDAAVASAPAVGRMLEGAVRIFEPRATADFSFRARTVRGPGWLALGDATGFVDPLFSTGAHLAMVGALRAADAIDAALTSGDTSPEAFAAWEQTMRAGTEMFIGAVQAFYAGELVDHIFAEPQHPFLRRAITSMLSGDVFDGSTLWIREMRARYPARA